ncbi:MAG: hypothetical protein FWC79_00495 [Oscillospiraceae bacterium]|nr:hypothetical protein [Oscillospiraceae bacterium]
MKRPIAKMDIVITNIYAYAIRTRVLRFVLSWAVRDTADTKRTIESSEF